MKLLKTSNADSVKYFQDQFRFKLPSELIPNHTAKSVAKLGHGLQTVFKSIESLEMCVIY